MNKIHKTAVIGPNVTLGDNVFIGAYAVIGTHAECTNLVDEFHDEEGVVTIGSGTVIRDHVTIHGSSMPHGRTIIGANCYIQAHAHIGRKRRKEPRRSLSSSRMRRTGSPTTSKLS